MPDRDHPGRVEPGELERLRSRLARERAVRREAETISEGATRRLYDQQQQLVLLSSVAHAANGASLEAAIRIALESIRVYCRWALGHAWMLDGSGDLRPTNIWVGEIERFGPLAESSGTVKLGAGEGLPGRVLASGEASWTPDLATDTLPRAPVAAAVGIHSAMAFPILIGAEVVGVLEFFSETIQRADPELLGLLAQVTAQLGRVAERERAANQLLHQATHDALTGLPNRVRVSEEVNRSLARVRRDRDRRAAVFFLDLDGFKAVNDSVGHGGGDRVLRDVATRLAGVIRPYDTLGRLSGDEFVVICDPISHEHSIAAIAGRINSALDDPFELDGELFQVTASMGITVIEAGKEVETLLNEADAAMYRAKERGRATTEVYSQKLGERLRRRAELERALRAAPDAGELRLHYQPEVDLKGGRLVGVEALLRWEREGSLVMPGDFIPVAEETGLIVPIGYWVLDAAADQMRAWQGDASIAAAPSVAVNLSIRQLADSALVTRVAEALGTSVDARGRLMLEVTESVILEDVEAGLAVLERLRGVGSEIAIDDFGTGYASLAYLAQFPAQELKIDRSFIGALADQRTHSVVATMIELAHALGMTAVAEGIETAEQLMMLRELGCDIGQGFYFAPGLEARQIEYLLRSGEPFCGRPPPSAPGAPGLAVGQIGAGAVSPEPSPRRSTWMPAP